MGNIYTQSPMQQGIFFHNMISKDNIYYDQVRFDIKGAFSADVFTKSIQVLINSHQALRSRYFLSNGDKPQLEIMDSREQKVAYKDISGLTQDEQEHETEKVSLSSRTKKRSIADGEIMDITLLKLSEDKHRVIWGCDHIAVDGWCMSLLVKELFEIYKKEASGEAVSIDEEPYSAYLEWSNSFDNSNVKKYWQKYLDDAPKPFEFPIVSNSVDHSCTERNVYRHLIDEEKFRAVSELAKSNHLTPGTIIQGLWGLLLCKYSDSSEAVWGCVVSGRSVPVKNADKMIGLFINTLPLIMRLDKTKPLLPQLKALAVDVFSGEFNGHINLTEIKDDREPIFNHIFAFENLEFASMTDGITLSGLNIENPCFYDRTNYDLAVKTQPGKELIMDFEYNPKVYSLETIEDIVKVYENLLTQLISDPQRIVSCYKSLAEQQEKDIILYVNQNYREEKAVTVQDRFTEIANKLLNKYAVKRDNESLTYGELLENAKHVAAYIISKGAVKGDIIGIDAEGTVENITAIFGILLAGCAYMPLDIKLPLKRREKYMNSAGVKLVFSSYPEKYGEGVQIIAADTAVKYNESINCSSIKHKNEDAAYVIFTSGSTGEPKGVRVSTGALCRMGMDNSDEFCGKAEDVVAQIAVLSFDVSVYEIFTTLLTGGTLVSAMPSEKDTAESLIEFFKAQHITRMVITPQLFNLITDIDEKCFGNFRVVMTGGEKASSKHYKKAADANPHTIFVNGYGPTEIVCCSSAYILKPFSPSSLDVPIGIADSRHYYYILDSDMNPVPVGVEGELYIGGDIAQGYYGRDDLTNERFIPDMYDPKKKIYKTGDIVKFGYDKEIIYVKRKDEQFKIRGFRIETGEIESAIESCPGVKQGFVRVVKDQSDDGRIWAYYTADEIIPAENIEKELKSVLPSYMMPSGYMQIETAPVTRNGKLDRELLPDIAMNNDVKFVLPENEIQSDLLDIWQEVLKNKDIGIRHNFFEEGGDSIKAMQIIGMMKKYGMNAEIRRLFDNPTVEKFSRYVYKGELEPQESVIGNVPLMPIQKFFFEKEFEEKNHFNQSVLLRCREEINVSSLAEILKELTIHHDALRMVYRFENGEWIQEDRETDAVSYTISEYTFGGGDEKVWLHKQAEIIQKAMDLEKGILISVGLLHLPDTLYIFIAVHHLVMDGVSFRILLRDFGELYQGYLLGKQTELIPKTVSYKKYSEAVAAASVKSPDALAKWEQTDVSGLEYISEKEHSCLLSERKSLIFSLDDNEKAGIDSYVNAQRGTNFSDLVLTASAVAVGSVKNMKKFAVDVEHNGRGFNNSSYDVSNTIGWFTSVYPLIYENKDNIETSAANVTEIQQISRSVSTEYMQKKVSSDTRNGIYGISSEICFNYLGDFDAAESSDSPFEIVEEMLGHNRSEKQLTGYVIDINTLSIHNKLYFMLDYNAALISDDEAESIFKSFRENIAEYSRLANDKQYEPFGLSSLQMSYFIGKQDFYELGGFTTHSYLEFLTKIDIPRFNKALQKIIDQQDMLRTVLRPDGTQNVLRDVPDYTIKILDIRDLPKEKQEEMIMQKREELSHSFFDIYKFPLFDISGFQINDEEKYLFISYDMIMMDSASVNLMVQDLAKYYLHPDLEAKPLKYHYRDYIHDLEEMRMQPIYNKAKEYWLSKLEDFPEAPQIPMITEPEKVEKGHFDRKRRVYTKEQLAVIKKQAAKHGMTISALLMSAYGHVLNFYSGMDRFTVNLTLFNRPNFNADIERMYGDFTSTILLDYDFNDVSDFWEESERVQASLGKALQYRIYDGIHFAKDVMKKFRYPTQKTLMPMVFTSLLFETDIMDDVAKLGEVQWSIGQTPQVYIDFQVMSEGGNLVIHMDYVSELFDSTMVDNYFNAFCGILDDVASGDEQIRMPQMTEAEQLQRENYNDTNDEQPPETTLVALFKKTMERCPEKIALISNGDEYTYAQLDELSDRVAEYLENKNMARRNVGLVTERKAGDIINILGILKVGGAYVPMLPEFPRERVGYICKSSNIDIILKADEYKTMPVSLQKERKDMPTPDDTAYILYTSGSTGTPKGVEIIHRTVSNTIISANDAYGIDESDVFIGLSALSFDMSVYDIFGTFEAGGCLITVPDVHAIEHIVELVEKYKVTVWQTVPALMQMYMNIRTEQQGQTLRHVLLGGDFIPKQLARDILEYLPNASFMSVGGPTETSIFDIYYPVSEVRDEWNSIPYGYPIRNQQIYIMDKNGRECPNEVRGEICVGGLGLAKGYVNMPELNAEKFFIHPKYGRIFRTGDYGIFKNEGYVEICGRIDGQVKIQGFRIELGEIENVYLNHENVSQVAALIFESKSGSRQIAVFVEGDIEKLDYDELLEYGSSYLTSYMRPSVLKIMEKIPLTPNNKINRRMLMESLEDEGTEKERVFTLPENEIEERLLTVWKKVLNLENAGVEDDFFESGGDSLKAMELLSAIKKELNWDTLLLTDILRSNTIRALSDFYISGGKKSILRKMSDISSDKQDAYFIHGGNGSADSYGYIIASAKDRYNCYGIDYLHEVKLAPEKISLKALAEEYAQEIMKNTPFDKSIMLVGWCIGGTICYEIAYILEQNGYKDINIRFFDTQAPGANMEYSYTVSGEIEFIKQYTSDMDTDALSDVENITLLWEKVVEMLERDSELKARVMKSFAEETAGVLMNTENMSVHEAMMINNFFRSLVDAAEKVSISGKLYYADAVYVHADKQSVTDHPEKWQEHFDRSVKFINVNETHFGILQTKDNKDLKI